MAGVKYPMAGVSYLPQSAIDHYAAEGVLTDETLTDVFEAACRRWPTRVAFSEPGVTMTYAKASVMTDRIAAALHRLGYKPLDRVLFQAANSKELLLTFIGCLKAGVIPICTLAAHRGNEIGQIGRQADAKGYIVAPSTGGFDLIEFARNMRSELPTLQHILTIRDDGVEHEGTHSLDKLALAEDPDEARATVAEIRTTLDPYQVAIFQLSGGTSGTPKIIPRFHNEYVNSARCIVEYFGFDETLVSFTPNPMLHNMPMACFSLPALIIGGEVAIAPRGDLESMQHIIQERRPNWCAIVLVHIMRLIENGAIDEHTFKDAYGLICIDKSAELSRMVNAPAYTLYGMTEGLLCHTRREDPPEAITRTVGRSVSPQDEIRLVEPGTQNDVGPGEVGELIIRGPSTIRGYYNAPEHNAGAFTVDGYYRSGDLMRWHVIDGQRYVSFEGRVKDVVSRGGEKINCSEVELAMCEHPKVTSVMCVGMPDVAYGERMCAFVMLTRGADTLSVGEIAKHLDGMGFAKFKFPERIEIVEGFPIASSGKPSKPMLRAIIAEKLQQEAALREPVSNAA
ncbi:AMP-binding protein [Polymorphobacter sp. PAMC 29334]|uniref:AMP-binding protein n=1 Tax=Polymorphobacter sp. PAMC 29334 TaxID=2862331 RepID=UPI001C798002|nr:AMP-binding protein [Polymorphobacter sp. PAMC 29334]QYE36366.1 AMP-binding protein [Polymorphobacter sp. PAMC 29334]